MCKTYFYFLMYFVQPLSNSSVFYYSYWLLALSVGIWITLAGYIYKIASSCDDVILFKILIAWIISLICSCSHCDHLESISSGKELVKQCKLWTVTSASQHWWQFSFFKVNSTCHVSAKSSVQNLYYDVEV